MSEKKIEEMKEDLSKKPPKSSKSNNTFKDFLKICRAYYDELMHISKNNTPSLSKKDILILSDVIDEIVTYSSELIASNFIPETKKLLDIGLVISDFFLKIFDKMVEEYSNKNKNTIQENPKINNALSEKMRFPLSLKLKLLKSNFKILFDKEKDYFNAEKNLKEIIEIQIYLKSSNNNLASSKFCLAKIEYFLEHYDEAENLALEAKDLYENSQKKNKEENIKEKNVNNNLDIEKNIAQNVSNVFRFLAQIYLIKNDFKSAATYYEHGYYLNLGRFGAENNDTIYFKKKLDTLNEELNKYPGFQFKLKKINNINNNNNDLNSPRSNINNNQGNILHKGQADTFSFKIPTSTLLEPFLITLYKIDKEGIKDKYSAELHFGNVMLDKQKLSKYLKLKGSNNININKLFYTDENLNVILGNLMINNGYLVFLDKELKNCLINSSCLIKKI